MGTTLVLAELHGHLLRRLDPREARRVLAALVADPAFAFDQDFATAGFELVE